MYCQACGAEIQPTLNYCNRCGASAHAKTELVALDVKSPVRTLGLTVGLTTVFGLIILLTGLSELSRTVGDKVLIPIGVLSLLTLLTIDIMLIRLLSRLIGHPTTEVRALAPPRESTSKRELHAPPHTPALAEVRPPSVTEHTTRTLNASYQPPTRI